MPTSGQRRIGSRATEGQWCRRNHRGNGHLTSRNSLFNDNGHAGNIASEKQMNSARQLAKSIYGLGISPGLVKEIRNRPELAPQWPA
jgi:hypothetical protein